MYAVPSTTGPGPSRGATEAAIAAFRRLQMKVGTIMLAYERPDGGLICERQSPGAPPLYYRVTASGGVDPDRRYDSTARRFLPVPLPTGID